MDLAVSTYTCMYVYVHTHTLCRMRKPFSILFAYKLFETGSLYSAKRRLGSWSVRSSWDTWKHDLTQEDVWTENEDSGQEIPLRLSMLSNKPFSNRLMSFTMLIRRKGDTVANFGPSVIMMAGSELTAGGRPLAQCKS